MAPVVAREAEHVRERAKKDLLGLLEGVSSLAIRWFVCNTEPASGPGQEESRAQQGTHRATASICWVCDTQRLWS